jgi:hypothetical protein
MKFRFPLGMGGTSGRPRRLCRMSRQSGTRPSDAGTTAGAARVPRVREPQDVARKRDTPSLTAKIHPRGALDGGERESGCGTPAHEKLGTPDQRPTISQSFGDCASNCRACRERRGDGRKSHREARCGEYEAAWAGRSLSEGSRRQRREVTSKTVDERQIGLTFSLFSEFMSGLLWILSILSGDPSLFGQFSEKIVNYMVTSFSKCGQLSTSHCKVCWARPSAC